MNHPPAFSVQSTSASVSTLSTPGKMYGFPELPYTLHTRKRAIAAVWSALIIVTSVQIEFFYFLLRYGTKSGLDNALTVPTAILLGVSILSMGLRTWHLVRKGSQRRPIGGRWYAVSESLPELCFAGSNLTTQPQLDYFSWNMVIGFIIVTAVLSAATADEPPNIRQASMPQAIVLYLASSQLIVTGIMAKLGWKTPVRFSSTSSGSPMKPGVFVLIEDIVAVDGGGFQAFREALVVRYESSEIFRRLVEQMNWFWGIGSMIVAGGTTAIVYAVPNLDVVFAIGWCLPWVWASIGAICTILWTRRMLVAEENSVTSSQA
ncbi:MAG: hypothetical protein M1818_002502 [Claussenomyces sp. TS43310]|nr:MAG: hypothetical protein M1818_002502 [Claussenomyces sp. TS43310]